MVSSAKAGRAPPRPAASAPAPRREILPSCHFNALVVIASSSVMHSVTLIAVACESLLLLHAEFADAGRDVVQRLRDDLPQLRRRRRHRRSSRPSRSSRGIRAWRRSRRYGGCSRSMIGCGVPAPAQMPSQPKRTKSMPFSVSVGMSDRLFSRSGADTARILSCLASYCGTIAERRRDVEMRRARRSAPAPPAGRRGTGSGSW